MRPTTIRKTAADLRVAPNAPLGWNQARQALDGLPGGGLNIAWEAVERHARGPLADHVAIRWHPATGTVRPITYRELSEASSRFANVLRSLGVARGDTVFVLCGRIPELYFAVLAGLRLGAAVSPLFSASGPEPIATRVNFGRGKVLVTTEALYQKKVAKIAVPMPTLEHVLRVDSPEFRQSFAAASAAQRVRSRSVDLAAIPQRLRHLVVTALPGPAAANLRRRPAGAGFQLHRRYPGAADRRRGRAGRQPPDHQPLGGTEPVTILATAELLAEMLDGATIEHCEPRHEVREAYCTTTRSRRLLGYRDKTPLREGLEQMRDWAELAWRTFPERQHRDVTPPLELERGLYPYWRRTWQV